MPTYDYRCPEGHEFELFQRMSDEPRAECPECGKEAARLLSGGAGFLFKGEGFYITDYRSEDYRKAAKADEKAAAANGGSSADKAGDGTSGKGSEKSAEHGSGRGSGKGEKGAAGKDSPAGSGKREKGAVGKDSPGGSGVSGTSSPTAG